MLRLADLGGSWRFRRLILAASGAEEGRAEGVIGFRPEGAGWLSEEMGELLLPGSAPMRAERRTFWREEAGRIALDFSDGRPFHAFDPSEPEPGAEHDCPPDFYRVAYDFHAFPLWRVAWRVTGPRKDYLSLTEQARDHAALAEWSALGQQAQKRLEDSRWQ